MSYFVVVSIMTSVFSTFLDLVVGRVEWPTCHVGGHGPKIPMSDLFVFGPHIHARSNAVPVYGEGSCMADKVVGPWAKQFRLTWTARPRIFSLSKKVLANTAVKFFECPGLVSLCISLSRFAFYELSVCTI